MMPFKAGQILDVPCIGEPGMSLLTPNLRAIEDFCPSLGVFLALKFDPTFGVISSFGSLLGIMVFLKEDSTEFTAIRQGVSDLLQVHGCRNGAEVNDAALDVFTRAFRF